MAAVKTPTKRKPATAKKTASRKVAPKKQIEKIQTEPTFTEEQWAALLNTYSTLKAAGLPIPKEVSDPVDTWLDRQKKQEDAEAAAQATEAEILAKEDAEGPKWIRNLYTSPFSLRLQRQSDPKHRRIELKPRGMRGDMFPLEPGDENDHVLRANIGRIEIIGDSTARRIAEGQTNNIQKTNTTLAMIRNEVGEPIQKLTVETEYNQQGVVVGYVDPNQQAKLEKGEFGKSKSPLGDLSRQPEQVQQFIPTGGNPAIISQGPVGSLTDNAKAAVEDTLARIKDRQGRPEDVLGLTVSVEPTKQG